MHRGRKSIPLYSSNILCLFNLTFKFRIENRNHHSHATTPMSSLANGFTSRLSNVSLLKMMKTSLSAMHRGRRSILVHCSNIVCLIWCSGALVVLHNYMVIGIVTCKWWFEEPWDKANQPCLISSSRAKWPFFALRAADKFFIGSTEFDTNFSLWSQYSSYDKNGIEHFFGNVSNVWNKSFLELKLSKNV